MESQTNGNSVAPLRVCSRSLTVQLDADLFGSRRPRFDTPGALGESVSSSRVIRQTVPCFGSDRHGRFGTVPCFGLGVSHRESVIVRGSGSTSVSDVRVGAPLVGVWSTRQAVASNVGPVAEDQAD